MGPEAAVNAVFANRIAAIDDPEEREAFVEEQRRDLRGGRRPAAAGLRARHRRGRAPEDLREELVRRFGWRGQGPHFSERRHGVPPV